MSTQNWMTLTPLAGGLRLITGKFKGGVVGSLSEFTVQVGNCERIIKPISISNDAGYVVEIQECNWREKSGYTETGLGPNDLVIVVRGHPYPLPGYAGYPHSLLPQYTDLTDVAFQIIAIVH